MTTSTGTPATRRAQRAAKADAGFTLPELLIAVMLSGLLTTVIATSILVMLRTAPQAELRLSESKDITFLQTWIPVDLSSAINSYDEAGDDEVFAALAASDISVTFTPLAGATASNSSGMPGYNLLTLVLPDLTNGSHKIIVYRYHEVAGDWRISRFRIDNPGAADQEVSVVGVAHEIPHPPGNDPISGLPIWNPGVDKAIHVFEITARNQVKIRPIGEDIRVKFDSGNEFSTGGAGLSAERVLDPFNETILPDPTAPPSRCGGRIALVLDTSFSVPGYDGGEDLKNAAAGFLDAFTGTPTEMTVMGFDSIAYQLHPNLNSTRGTYFNMLTDTADIQTAKSNILALPNRDTAYQGYNSFARGGTYYRNPPATGTGPVANKNIGWSQVRATEGGPTVSGGTNWEDALHAPFFEETGAQRLITPESVVFITDGDPNRKRSDFFSSGYAGTNVVAAQTAANAGRSTGARIIGVLVGGGSTGSLESNLSSVVGTNKWNGSSPTDLGNAVAADYFAGSFDQLGDVLKAISAAQCGGTVTMQKTFNSAVPTPHPAGDWVYSSENGNGTLDLDVAVSLTMDFQFAPGEFTREVTIYEEPRAGFTFLGATCQAGGQPIATTDAPDGPGVVIELQPDQAVSCEMLSGPA